MAAARLTGVLLVGGASRRFGRAKALASYEGETLAERAWRTLAHVCDERLAVGKRADALPLPFPLVDDGSDVRAPLAGIVAGLRAGSAEVAIFLPVDVPLVRPEDLRRLADGCGEVAVPQAGPLPCAIRRAALPALEQSLRTRELSLRAAFARLATRVVDVDPTTLVNVNTQEDLDLLPAPDRAVPSGTRDGGARSAR